MPALTDQAGEMAGACGRAKKMEEGLAAAASQAAQQQRRVEQLERASEVRPIVRGHRFSHHQCRHRLCATERVLNCLSVSCRRGPLPRERLLVSRQAEAALMPLLPGSGQRAPGSSGPWTRQQGLLQR